MDEGALKAILTTLNLPVAYHHFVSPPKPPYIVYLFSYNSNFGADNKVYKAIKNFQVELYTSKKNSTLETLIEGLFNTQDIYWDKAETYIESEKLYQVMYEI